MFLIRKQSAVIAQPQKELTIFFRGERLRVLSDWANILVSSGPTPRWISERQCRNEIGMKDESDKKSMKCWIELHEDGSDQIRQGETGCGWKLLRIAFWSTFAEDEQSVANLRGVELNEMDEKGMGRVSGMKKGAGMKDEDW